LPVSRPGQGVKNPGIRAVKYRLSVNDFYSQPPVHGAFARPANLNMLNKFEFFSDGVNIAKFFVVA
jgi:hypothetical protein